MRRIIGLFAAFMFVLVSTALAHPPSDILFDYNAVSKTLKVTIMHDSKDINKHFVDEINVTLNGKKKIMQQAATQTDGTGQVLTYMLPEAQTGDKIEVSADCSVFGTLTKGFVIQPDKKMAKKK